MEPDAGVAGTSKACAAIASTVALIWLTGMLGSNTFAQEIEEDRQSLEEIMQALGVGIDRLKVAAGWTAEKLGRLKLNGRLLGYSPLSRVVELEALILGVRGKLALWRSLEALEPEQLAQARLTELVARADRQLEGLESHRLRAVEDAFGSA